MSTARIRSTPSVESTARARPSYWAQNQERPAYRRVSDNYGISLNANAISRASEILFLSHDDQQTLLDSINREVPAERSSAGERLRDQLSLVIIVRLFTSPHFRHCSEMFNKGCGAGLHLIRKCELVRLWERHGLQSGVIVMTFRSVWKNALASGNLVEAFLLF